MKNDFLNTTTLPSEPAANKRAVMSAPIAPTASHSSAASACQPTMPRQEALEMLRTELGVERGRIHQQFEQRRTNGVETARNLALLMDHIIGELARHAGLPHHDGQTAGGEAFCLCATGGYGAGLLAPFSDVDLLFLTEAPPSDGLIRAIEYVLYTLWDLGLQVGHATRTIDSAMEMARTDQTSCTTLLDIRPLYGRNDLVLTLQGRLEAHLKGPELERFVLQAITQREDRHRRFGETPYLVEPHIKEGKGGLRDLQVLNWIGYAVLGNGLSVKSNLQRAQGLAPACTLLGLLTKREISRTHGLWNFLWTVRLNLHYITGRNEERLTFDVQPIIGARMRYGNHGHQRGVERFMRHHFLMARAVMRLTHVIQPAILLHLRNQLQHRPPRVETGPEGFQRIDGCLSLPNPLDLVRTPVTVLRFLDCARQHQLALHPAAIQQIIRFERHSASLRHNEEASALFIRLLCDPAAEAPVAPMTAGHPAIRGTDHDDDDEQSRIFWLPLLNETGILSHLLPGWSRILGRTQFDGYHIHTVEAHTIESVRILRMIEQGRMADELPLAYRLARTMTQRPLLYLATLLHDIGKGRGGNHSEIGADIATTICQQLGFSASDTDTVSWLVLHHLLLSRTAFSRDIDDPQTILDLADTIQSPKRLRLLLLLTIADIRAVGPRAWNAWKATLLGRLYTRIADVLEGGLQAQEDDERVEHIRSLVQQELKEEGMSAPAITGFMKLGRPGYWLGFDTQSHLRHARLVSEHQASGRDDAIIVDIEPLPTRGITELTVFCKDQPGLFSRITGALALCGATIADARIHTLNNGMVLDTFWFQDPHGEAFMEPGHVERLRDTIMQVMEGRINLDETLSAASFPLPRRLEALPIPSRVLIDNDASENHSIVEVNGRDRPALLHNITATLSRLKLHISSAHVMTYGLRAVDVFYVTDATGHKLATAEQEEALQTALLETLRHTEAEIA
ncbi:[protein-PII] uridylyltransferase [Bombella sp. TMW 2.2559]|uniref:Bifunctional uridylyltransferase/uridylyl-removing enzyme n=1 Tax=Bombella dulcis TaxID=2967339 RepID=A0ABT3W8Z3_9PROT|nr:[protein-PII] uridylyltransferase [Bombella dulcis]MCX5615547.1 [protein-PII] uridylyltransferase [Bombella dulcis]